MEELAVRNLWRRAVTFPHGRASSEKLVKGNGHISSTWKCYIFAVRATCEGERSHFRMQELAMKNL